MSMRLLMLRATLRNMQSKVAGAAKAVAQARKGRSIGGDVCLGVEECDQLIKDLREAEAAINELLERAGG